MAKRLWIVTRFAEALPLFGTDKNGPGPFYAPGATFYDRPDHRSFVEFRAARWREHGFTVTIAEVRR